MNSPKIVDACKCSDMTDIRVRCMPREISWDTCPMKEHTRGWLIDNGSYELNCAPRSLCGDTILPPPKIGDMVDKKLLLYIRHLEQTECKAHDMKKNIENLYKANCQT